MEFKITLSNLGQLNEGNNVSEDIIFPAESDKLTAAYNRVSYNGQNDVIITLDDASFNFGQYESLTLLNKIANLDSEKYEAFVILTNHMSVRESYNMVTESNLQIFRDVEDLGDVARHVLAEDVEFQNFPDYVKRNFDFDAFGEELDSGSSFYEDFKNQMLVEIFN